MSTVDKMTAGRRTAGPRRPTLVICAAAYWSGMTMLDHHLARELSRYADVVYVDRPASALTRFRHPAAAAASEGPRTERISPALTVVRPRVNPSVESRFGKPLSLYLVRRAMRRAVRELGWPQVDAVIVPSTDPLLGVLGEKVSVFYASDDLAAGAELLGVPRAVLRARLARLSAAADVTVAVSQTLVESLHRDGIEALLVPNGVETEHFAATATATVPADVAALLDRPGAVVGFAGNLGDRIDVRLLESVVDRGHTLLLVGPRQRTASDPALDRLLARPEVRWLGMRPYAELPAIFAATDTWLLPYAQSDFNRASFPLKVLEYLAAGRRVVATDLPAIGWLDTDLIVTAGQPAAFADAVDAAVAAPLTPAEQLERREFAGRHGWQARGRTLAAAIGLIPHEDTPAPVSPEPGPTRSKGAR